MKKIKLNIQMFASTNKTTNYELPQFVGTDKPSWLGDFNEAMLTIDTGMHGNATAIDGVESTSQTAKSTANQALQGVSSLSDTVSSQGSAISSIDGRVTTINSTLTTQGTAISSIDGRVKTLETDNTTNKSNIAKNTTDISNLTNYLALTDNRALTNPVITQGGGSITNNSMRIALNDTGTLGKIYGTINLSGQTNYPRVKFTNTGIMGVTESFTITPAGMACPLSSTNAANLNIQVNPPANNETSASIELRFANYTNGGNTLGVVMPCIYLFKNFGDVEG